jgi:7-cyano-7-deazaguanine synthase in queuosine biosynthesis
LDAVSPSGDVNIKIEDVAEPFLRNLSPRLTDLLEIAAYVFTADAATARGAGLYEDGTEQWGREFEFVIPVRDLQFWMQADVGALLSQLLTFLSDDKYHFAFEQLALDRSVQEYLSLVDSGWPVLGADPSVIMFSGGLDSLAGAAQMAAQGKSLVLVSHRSAPTMDKRQRDLFSSLRARFPKVAMQHVPVWVNKHKGLDREPTQRTRSFLFGALGAVVAGMIGAPDVTFFENGVVSLNFPVADEVLRARASRTTHPQALRLLQHLYSLVLDRPFAVRNPFLFMTKADVVREISTCGAQDMIGLTRSCAHTIFTAKAQQHCGTCSQCIDRRFGVLGAGLGQFDPEVDYAVDVFLGARRPGYPRNMALNYVRHATELIRLGDEGIVARFGVELGRAVRGAGDVKGVADQIVQMHVRHARTVVSVLAEAMRANASSLVSGDIPSSSLLGMTAAGTHHNTAWNQFADRISEILRRGLPRACRSHSPTDEPHLQEICDGLLAGEEGSLVREFPFVRWSSSLTKPDWSTTDGTLWVELKYVRKRADIHAITEAIAADLTKYGDSGRPTLFVIYDPAQQVADRSAFASPITARQGMLVAFVP